MSSYKEGTCYSALSSQHIRICCHYYLYYHPHNQQWHYCMAWWLRCQSHFMLIAWIQI